MARNSWTPSRTLRADGQLKRGLLALGFADGSGPRRAHRARYRGRRAGPPPASALAQVPDATLASQCSDQQVAPVSVVVACADGGIIPSAADVAAVGFRSRHGDGCCVREHL